MSMPWSHYNVCDQQVYVDTFLFCFYLSYPYLLFFSLLPFLSFPTFSFLKLQPIRAITVKCDGSVYHIDVDDTLVYAE